MSAIDRHHPELVDAGGGSGPSGNDLDSAGPEPAACECGHGTEEAWRHDFDCPVYEDWADA